MSGRCIPPSNGSFRQKTSPGEDVAVEPLDHRGEGRRKRAQVAGQRQPLRDKAAVGVGERRREVHVVAQHAGIGCPADGHRHLVGDGEDGVPEQLEGDRVVHGRPWRSWCGCAPPVAGANGPGPITRHWEQLRERKRRPRMVPPTPGRSRGHPEAGGVVPRIGWFFQDPDPPCAAGRGRGTRVGAASVSSAGDSFGDDGSKRAVPAAVSGVPGSGGDGAGAGPVEGSRAARRRITGGARRSGRARDTIPARIPFPNPSELRSAPGRNTSGIRPPSPPARSAPPPAAGRTAPWGRPSPLPVPHRAFSADRGAVRRSSPLPRVCPRSDRADGWRRARVRRPSPAAAGTMPS